VQLGYGTANAIFISGSDIYIAGLVYKGGGTFLPAYWKNGVLVTLPGSGNPIAIAVVAP
jgi:hypothetical protein